jgi:hypothetical protein
VGISADESFVTINIEEVQPLVGTNHLMMMFDAKDYRLKQWTITDVQGFDTTIAVSNLDASKRPDRSVQDRLYAYVSRRRTDDRRRRRGESALRLIRRLVRPPLSDGSDASFHFNLEHQFGAPAHRVGWRNSSRRSARTCCACRRPSARTTNFRASDSSGSATSTSPSTDRRVITAWWCFRACR